jgi:ADP-heptose:LPS heptosyltransferase
VKGWAGVARLGGLGDCLIAASVLRPLKRLGYMTEMITSEHGHPIFLNNPFLDKLTVKGPDSEPEGGWHKWHINRAKEYDIYACLSHSCEVRHALFVASEAFWWRPEVRRKLCAGSYLETAHDIVGVPYEFGPVFHPTEEEQANARKLVEQKIGGKFVTWVISGSRIDKIYPYTPPAVARIIKDLDVPVVLMGAGQMQHEQAEQIRDAVKRQNSGRDKLHIMVSHEGMPPEQRWGVRPALSLLLQADCVITPDTGPAWATCMEPMAKIVLISHASVENITKHWRNTIALSADPIRVPCHPCHRLHDHISTCVPNKDTGNAAACISDISVDTIIASVRKVMRAA